MNPLVDPNARSFTPQATIQNQRATGNSLMAEALQGKRLASPVAPLANLLGGVAGGLRQTAADTGERDNQSMMVQALQQAGNAGGGMEAANGLINSGIPSLQQYGMQMQQQARQQAAQAAQQQQRAAVEAQRYQDTKDHRDRMFALQERRANAGPEPTSLQRDLAAAGLQPGTPEYQQAIMRARTRPNTVVNNGGETKFEETLGKLDAEQFVQSREAAQESGVKINRLRQLDELLSNDALFTGTLGETTAGFKRALGTAFGVPVDGMAEADAFGALSNLVALDDLSGFRGSTTNKELDFIRDAQPTLSKSREGNQLLIQLKMLEQQLVNDRYEIMSEFGGRSSPEMQRAINQLNQSYGRRAREAIRQIRSMNIQQPGIGAGIPTDLIQEFGLDVE